MYDVQWSPIHPALFAAVDGTGRLDLWNLNNDTEVQIWTILFRLNARELLPPNLPHFAPLQVPTASTHSESMTSLNRLRWTHSGHQIAVGDDDGHVFIYDVGEVRELTKNVKLSRVEYKKVPAHSVFIARGNCLEICLANYPPTPSLSQHQHLLLT